MEKGFKFPLLSLTSLRMTERETGEFVLIKISLIKLDGK